MLNSNASEGWSGKPPKGEISSEAMSLKIKHILSLSIKYFPDKFYKIKVFVTHYLHSLTQWVADESLFKTQSSKDIQNNGQHW